jgi:hypothetical protein
MMTSVRIPEIYSEKEKELESRESPNGLNVPKLEVE